MCLRTWTDYFKTWRMANITNTDIHRIMYTVKMNTTEYVKSNQ